MDLDLPAPPFFFDAVDAAAGTWRPRQDRIEVFERLLDRRIECVFGIGAERVGDPGPFRLIGPDVDVVAKGFSAHLAVRQARVESILASLTGSVPALSAIEPNAVSACGMSWWLYPYLNGHVARSEHEDAALSGHALGKVHVGLSRLPQSSEIGHAANTRWQGLLNIGLFDHPRAGALAKECGPVANDLRNGRDAQPLHGDVNPGNILISRSSAVIIDFEELPHAHGSPVLDLAKLVERLALSSEKAVDLGRVLVSHWIQAREEVPLPRVGLLADAVAANNLYSLAILVALERSGNPASEAEWKKFERLTTALPQVRILCQEIEAGYVA